jgi:hypothetical protein
VLPPPSLDAVAPLPGLAGRIGRTATAIGFTVDDLAFSLSPAFLAYSGGGLRGGSFAVRRGRVIIRRFEAVHGVRVSGIARRGGLRLRVEGPAAAPGRVRLTRSGRLRGRLGGHRVDVRLRGAGAAIASVSFRAPLVRRPLRAVLRPSRRDLRSDHRASRVFRASFARPKSHPRLVPSPVR